MRLNKPWIIRVTLTLLALILLYQGWLFVRVVDLRDGAPKRTAVMEERLAEMETNGKQPQLDYRWVPMKRISPFLQRALIVSEDATFYGHEGFDWEGIKVAATKNIKKGEVVAGGSTITQQLAKNLFLSTGRTPWRKAEEAIITVMLEKTLSKRRIFEIYLNVIEWGNGVFGAEAASRHYFGKSASALTPSEAARLAAMVPAPRYYDRHGITPRLARKINVIMRRMAKRYGTNFDSAPRFVAPPAEIPLTPVPPESAEPVSGVPEEDTQVAPSAPPSELLVPEAKDSPPEANVEAIP